MSISITKRNGEKEPFNADKINRSIERAAIGLADPISMVTQIATETQLTLYDGMTTEEMDKATINAAIQNIKEDIEYDKVATRLFLKTIYRRVVGDYDIDDTSDLKRKHAEAFITYVKSGVAEGRLHEKMLAFDLAKLADALSIERDELFVYAGVDGLINRYGMKDKDQQSLETPQFFFMRVAMGLSYNEADPTEAAIKFYEKMSRLQYIAGGSTNLGAGTVRSSLSNCFLLEIHDDMAHIAKSVSDVMMLSKDSGGLGVSLTKLRATGSPLLSNFGGASSGPTPFAKIIDTAIRAIQRGGKKKGALCFYMENWHYDFPEFIDWKHNAGDDYLRMRTADTAAWLSDEFMKRVEANEDWYMFDPKETPDLNELYGQAFSKRYREYVELAKAGKMRMVKRVPATEQWHQILTALQSTSHPWLTWKDSSNLRALNNNTGTIHMSNLCTEIMLPQDKQNIAVCNLISINIAAHIENKEVNWSKLEETVRLGVRHLDNLIDINKLSIPEASRSDKENRAVGLGVMGFADALERLSMSYESPHAWDFADRLFEFVSYMAIDESANLARERGSYQHFEGSRWSLGMVPLDTIEVLEQDRGMQIDLPKITKQKRLDWDKLRAKVKGGMRNSTLMAVAPNANIGLLAGTTPGIDPRFAQVFSRNKISGKYLDLNHNLVKDLKNMGLWDDIKELIIENQGDISNVPGIPNYLKEIYRTAFTTNPHAYIEVAARAQKWVDQALSRNMYLESRDMDEMKGIYMSAWKKGLKTTYYLHMKPRHTAEQSTTTVNKAQMTGKRGFGAVKLAAVASIPTAEATPLESSTPTPVIIETTPFMPSHMPVSNPLGFSTVSSTPSPLSVNPSTVIPESPVGVRQSAQLPITPILAETHIEVRASVEPIVAQAQVMTPVMPAMPQQAQQPTSAFQTPAPSVPVAAPVKASNNYENMPEDPAEGPNVCISCQ
jgi:ribonucleoside-diphosphate reductase alpha chain